MDLVDLVYSYTKAYPKDELFALASQTQRSAVSVPSNIAEGSQRTSGKEFIRFLNSAYSSLAELETQLEIAYRQSNISDGQLSDCFQVTSDIGKMLNGLIASINTTKHSQPQTADS